ncbi:MAG: beta-N-acetylhexosaminidase [Pseudomonadota bacterium]
MFLPVIFGVSSTELTDEERAFLTEHRPAGFILFARNCKSSAQVQALTASLKQLAWLQPAPILIDQEGGRVQRMRAPEWHNYSAAATLGASYNHAPEAVLDLITAFNWLLADELFTHGINVNCAPVLDLPQEDADPIIGDRAFSNLIDPLIAMARAQVEGLGKAGVLPVIKHIPGHGRARVDSHLALPMVDTAIDDLRAHDFLPFEALSDAPLAMTAHILFSAIDRERPVTLSRYFINEVIRNEIGLDGVLMSDDLSMKALGGEIGARAADALAAGCDLALHCNGDLAEMEKIALAVEPVSLANTPRLANLQKISLMQASKRLPVPEDEFDDRYRELTDRLAALTKHHSA